MPQLPPDHNPAGSTPPVLLGTYTPPAVGVGARVYCRFRRARCRVTSYTDAPIEWPRVRNPKFTGGGSGLLVNAELQRAIRTGSAAALMHWFGVKVTTAWRWRTWLKVEGHTATRGSRALQRSTSAKGAAGIKAKDWTDAECDAKSATAKRIGVRYPNRWAETGWTPAELALLGTDTDAAIAAKLGRSRSAVRTMRFRRGILPASRTTAAGNGSARESVR